MIEKKQLEEFIGKFCKLILNNGYNYIGYLKEVGETSIKFDDRFDGIYLFDIDYIKSVGGVKDE